MTLYSLTITKEKKDQGSLPTEIILRIIVPQSWKQPEMSSSQLPVFTSEINEAQRNEVILLRPHSFPVKLLLELRIMVF